MMQVRTEIQLNPVADEVSALIAVVRPILFGLLFALKREVVAEIGTHKDIKLLMLPRLYRPGDGDCGLCFEYAVHDAIKRNDPLVVERVNDAMLKFCRMTGTNTSSILFGAEKNGAVQIIDTAMEILTEESRVLTGTQAQPVKLKNYINMLAAAFRRPNTRPSLPTSIGGLWKADLFLGFTDTDRWVGTTVKINPKTLEGATGLRIGLVPAEQGKNDKIYRDESKNLVVCPLPYDGAFMEIFYRGWFIVQQFLAADARLPKEVALPYSSERFVANMLAERREFNVLEVIEALQPMAQPYLLHTNSISTNSYSTREGDANLDTLIAPISQKY